MSVDREYLRKDSDAQPLLSFTPRILNVQDDNVWVDNVIDFGDLLEKQMGVEASELFFSVISELVSEILYGDDTEDDSGD